MTPTWYRKYWRPWGKVIGHHDEAFLHCGDRVVRVSRHFDDRGRIKHYCCSQLPGGYSSGNWWRKTWAAMLAAVVQEFGEVQTEVAT